MTRARLEVSAVLLLLGGLTLACRGEGNREARAQREAVEPAAAVPDSAAAKGNSNGREAAMTIQLTSSAFTAGASIPPQYTCDGGDVSPPLAWSGVPAGARSLALIIDDPDAPDPRAPKRVWVHWVLYDVPPTATSLAEGASPRSLPKGAHEGVNDFGKTGYGGPCPPTGRHRYFHKLYALDTVLSQLDRPKKADLERAMAGHILAQAELVGTYERGR